MRGPLWRLLWDSKRDAVFDISLVIGLHLTGRLLGYLYEPETPLDAYAWIGGVWASQVLNGLMDLLLVARRRFPVVLLSAAAALAAAQALLIEFGPGPLLQNNLETDPWGPGVTPFAVYAAVVYASGPRAKRVWVWALIGVLALVAFRPWTLPGTDPIVAAAIWTVLPAILGLYIGARRKLMNALQERAERAEREQRLLAEQARAEERARLAVEMHDVVTHRVSLMVLQAGALGVASTDPAVRQAAEELRGSGAEALAELRDLVGVLRRGEDERQPGRGDGPPEQVPDLGELIAQSEAIGVPVEFTAEGEPDLVTPAVARTAYRVVQEALTNVHKHAAGASVRVSAVYSDDRVRLTVRNTAPRGPAELAGSGAGVGLRGLRQRVELVGGTFRAGPTDGGGFEVDAILPGYVPTEEAADA
ncbi:sensor histidine kinase [Saccharopolyspora griseoalba]|uniref:histidine kinase n=1 Tax=Saccharopolyspora griseoalba TaxID=1431848 RepID=A0ABW2LKN6_9PSEU